MRINRKGDKRPRIYFHELPREEIIKRLVFALVLGGMSFLRKEFLYDGKGGIIASEIGLLGRPY